MDHRTTQQSHPPALPAAWHEHAEYETQAAYAAGYRQALLDVAAGTVELDTTWIGPGRLTHAQRIADRIALFEQCAARLAELMHRPAGYTYRGGPVPVWGPTREARREAA